MKFEVGGHEGGSEFGVCGCACAGAPDLGGDVVELLAVLGSVSGLMGGMKDGEGTDNTLSATMGPLVARVSAAMTTPPL